MKGRLTILCDGDKVRLEVEDTESHIQFLRATITPKDFTAALGRLCCVPMEMELTGLEHVGKKRIIKKFEFPIKKPTDNGYSDNKKLACEEILKVCPEGWTPRTYFGSQDSFFYKNKQLYARTIIFKFEELPDDSTGTV